MAAEWQTCSLKEAGVQLIDCDHKTPKAQESGFPYIGIPQMKGGNIDFDANPRLISQSDLVTWTKKAKPQTNDVILSRRCNSGETVHVASRTEFALGQNLVILRSVGERVFPPYLRWVVRSPQWWAEVGKYLNPGAIFESLKCADIPKFKVPFPPLPEQKAIAHILGSLDDKIELNRRMNETLEGMAQALFKSWFVDFDPVIDNVLMKNMEEFCSQNTSSKQPSSPLLPGGEEPFDAEQSLALWERLGEGAFKGIPDALRGRAETRRTAIANGTANRDAAKAFPSAFQETEEMGWIPKGWEVVELGSCATVKGGKRLPKGNALTEKPTNHPYIRTRDISGTEIDVSKLLFVPNDVFPSISRYIVEKDDIVISIVGTVGLCALIPQELHLASLTENCARITTLNAESMSQNFLFYYLICSERQEEIRTRTVGSTQPKLPLYNIKSIPVPLPLASKITQFESIAKPLQTKISANRSQIRTLAKLRDTLLPKLISGELRIEDAGKMVEGAE